MSSPYDKEISQSLKRIAAAMETLAVNFKNSGEQATIAGKSIADAQDHVQFISEDGE